MIGAKSASVNVLTNMMSDTVCHFETLQLTIGIAPADKHSFALKTEFEMPHQSHV